MTDPTAAGGYALAALAYLAVGLGLARLPLMAAAVLVTAAWAGAEALAAWRPIDARLPLILEAARTGAWLAFLFALLGPGPETAIRRALLAAGVVGVAGQALLALFGSGGMAADALRILLVLAPVLALLLIENLYRNGDREGRWAVKYLCFGLGLLFAYDFYLWADAALLHRIDPALFAARGFVDAMAAPVVLLGARRAGSWPAVRLSRRVVFHSAALLGSGLYLMAMSGVALSLRGLGESWGPVAQAVFLSGAVVLLLAIFASGAARARARVLLVKHFFRYRYDYREEWLRFIATISAGEGRLGERVVKGLADILDAGGGALWRLRPEDGALWPAASWNFGPVLPALAAESPFARFLAERRWVLDLEELRAEDTPVAAPAWLLAHPRAHTVVPLIHGETLAGIVVLDRPRAARPLDWEDRDLLKTAGRQAAAHLAEEDANRALADARRLEAFNHRFAFVAHDVKNVVGQMSLLLGNAERFGADPEFQCDMLATVRGSVGRLRGLLDQLAQARRDSGGRPVALSAIAAAAAGRWARVHPGLQAQLSPDLAALADAEDLSSVLDHLLANAVEAAGPGGRVALRLARRGDQAVIEIEDDGPGMDAAFVGERLFRPLDGAKPGGFGLGAFQVRQLVRDMGGRLEVASAPGRGTRMRVVLPLAAVAQPQAGE